MLEKIKGPEDVRRLSLAELKMLAQDVRERILEVTAKNGGHLAPSLGAVEIAVALLRVFNPRRDRVVWDVGHQSYAWKILTGRNDRFDTLRQFGGISGFNNIFESEYDAFGVGHSSTSISAALGINVADEMMGRKGRTIAVIGDGALTGGMSFEAINHCGHLQKNLIVILNDNAMSISKNVGALQSYMANILVSKTYNTLKERVWDLSHTLPTNIRRRFITGAQKLEESLINILVPNIIFEDLGFKYVGPIDGHDLPRLAHIFNKARHNIVGPVLIHVVTQKGKGCDFAENNARVFHGVGPYEEKTGASLSKKGQSYSGVFGDKLCELAAEHKNVAAITAAMTDGTGLTEFARKYPDRFFDVGIAEQHAVTFAGGLAVRGVKPFVAIYSTFLQRALDQIIHDIALQKLPVVFCLDRAGLVGDDGATHHGVFDLSYLRLIPNLQILSPCCAEELESMMDYAMHYDDGPIAIRYPRGNARLCEMEHPIIESGKWEIVREGEKVAFIGTGKGMIDAVEVAELFGDAIKPWLINARFVKPMDTALLDELKKKVDYIVTIEDGSLEGGFGQAVQAYFNGSGVMVHTFGIPDRFVTHGRVDQLKEMLGITPQQIHQKLKDIL